MEFRAASRLPQAPAREGRKPVVCRTHNIWEPLPRLPENPGKPRTRGSGVLSLSAYATIWHRPLVPAETEAAAGDRFGLCHEPLSPQLATGRHLPGSTAGKRRPYSASRPEQTTNSKQSQQTRTATYSDFANLLPMSYVSIHSNWYDPILPFPSRGMPRSASRGTKRRTNTIFYQPGIGCAIYYPLVQRLVYGRKSSSVKLKAKHLSRKRRSSSRSDRTQLNR